MKQLGHLIRKVTVDDRPAILALLKAAFEQDNEAELVAELWDQHAVKFERLAEVGGEVIGYCAYSPITCKPELDGMLLGLGPLAVAPTHQRQGVGAQLVTETLQICRDNDTRLIAVLGDPAYYSRFGFEPAAKKKMSWAGFDAGDAFRVLDRGDIETDDIRIIHYHPAFDKFS